MKKPDADLLKEYQQVDFDADGIKQSRIWARIQTKPAGAFRLKWALAGAASMLLVTGIVLYTQKETIFNAKQPDFICSVVEQNGKTLVVSTPPAPQPLREEDPTEEDCIRINTRYLMTQAAKQQSVFLARAKDCPTKDKISAYDSKIISVLEKEIKTYSQEAFSTQDLKKLKTCTDKFQPKVHPVLLYKMDC